MTEIKRSHPAGNRVTTQVMFGGDSADTSLADSGDARLQDTCAGQVIS